MRTLSPWCGRQLEPSRVVQILFADDKGSYGSGYRITSELVLSAAHVAGKVRRPGRRAKGWWDRDGYVDAEVVWIGAADLALLRLENGADHVAPAAWGRVRRSATAPVPIRLIGYPRSNELDGVRSKDERNGFISPSSYAEHDLYALDVEGA